MKILKKLKSFNLMYVILLLILIQTCSMQIDINNLTEFSPFCAACECGDLVAEELKDKIIDR